MAIYTATQSSMKSVTYSRFFFLNSILNKQLLLSSHCCLETVMGQYKHSWSTGLQDDEETSEFVSELNDFYGRVECSHLNENLLAVVSDLRDRVDNGESWLSRIWDTWLVWMSSISKALIRMKRLILIMYVADCWNHALLSCVSYSAGCSHSR